jgi:hypothetical protein
MRLSIHFCNSTDLLEMAVLAHKTCSSTLGMNCHLHPPEADLSPEKSLRQKGCGRCWGHQSANVRFRAAQVLEMNCRLHLPGADLPHGKIPRQKGGGTVWDRHNAKVLSRAAQVKLIIFYIRYSRAKRQSRTQKYHGTVCVTFFRISIVLMGDQVPDVDSNLRIQKAS